MCKKNEYRYNKYRKIFSTKVTYNLKKISKKELTS